MSDSEQSKATEELKMMGEYAVTPMDLELALAHLLSPYDAAGNMKPQASTMIWGAMGIGKTEIVRALAKKWGRRVVALHLPQMDPTDLKGIPVRMEDGRVVWKSSSYLPQELDIVVTRDMLGDNGKLGEKWEVEKNMPAAEDISVTVMDREGKVILRNNDQMSGSIPLDGSKVDIDMIHKTVTLKLTPNKGHKSYLGYTIRITDKAILFLDELSASVPQVQNAALQLVLDKRVGEYDVPRTCPIVAAGNRESDAAFVHPMSAPLSNRFCHLRLMVSLDDWLDWALPRKIHPHVIGYLQWKGSSALLKFDPDKLAEGDGGFPSPRSWTLLSKQMTRELKTQVMNAIIAGFVGKAQGADFISYRDICELLPSTDDILCGREINIEGSLDIGQKYGLATALCYKLKDYHDKWYDDDIDTDTPEKQPDEWRVAASSYCDFVDKYLGMEMTILCIHIVSRHLHISFIKFKGDKGNRFAAFAKKYRDVLRKVV